MCIEYISELEEWLEKNNIRKEDVCIVGSASLAYDGIRINHDLEIAVRPGIYIEKIQKSWMPRVAFNLYKNIDYFKNQFFCIGITDKEVFEKKMYRLTKDGYQVILLEIEYLYKLSLGRDKDKMDIDLIEKTNPDIKERSKSFKRKAIFPKIICILLNILRSLKHAILKCLRGVI